MKPTGLALGLLVIIKQGAGTLALMQARRLMATQVGRVQ